jgi:hypothetical protein
LAFENKRALTKIKIAIKALIGDFFVDSFMFERVLGFNKNDLFISAVAKKENE